jgi:SAGA-associated factor 29
MTEAKERGLTVNTEVLYRSREEGLDIVEGEGILCRITSIIGEGKQRRYEIINSDPDLPDPAIPYCPSVKYLVPIPSITSNSILPDLPAKRNVLALYPGTTTFYKAEVVSGWTAAKVKEGDGRGVENFVKLRFEGEDEVDRDMSIERRYVLPEN